MDEGNGNIVLKPPAWLASVLRMKVGEREKLARVLEVRAAAIRLTLPTRRTKRQPRPDLRQRQCEHQEN